MGTKNVSTRSKLLVLRTLWVHCTETVGIIGSYLYIHIHTMALFQNPCELPSLATAFCAFLNGLKLDKWLIWSAPHSRQIAFCTQEILLMIYFNKGKHNTLTLVFNYFKSNNLSFYNQLFFLSSSQICSCTQRSALWDCLHCLGYMRSCRKNRRKPDISGIIIFSAFWNSRSVTSVPQNAAYWGSLLSFGSERFTPSLWFTKSCQARISMLPNPRVSL